MNYGSVFLATAIVSVLSTGASAQIIVTTSAGAPGDPLQAPAYVAFDKAGNLFVSEPATHRIRRIDKSGAISTVVGTGASGSTGDGGPALAATLTCPAGIAFGTAGHLLIADRCANVVRTVSPSTSDGLIKGRPDETISLFAGGGGMFSPGPGVAPTDLNLVQPAFVAVDAADSVYIGMETTFDVTVIGIGASGNTWTVAEVSWVSPLSLGVDNAGFVLAGGDDNDYPLLTCIDPAGTSPHNFQAIPVFNSYQASRRSGIVSDPLGRLYTNIDSNHSIVRFDAPAGPCAYDPATIVPFAGTGVAGYSGDGGAPAAAMLNTPTGLAFNSAGNLFIADTGNNVIRAVIAGTPTDASHLTVVPNDQNGDPSPVTVTFGGIPPGGDGVTAVVVSPSGPALPAGFQLVGGAPLFYDVVTSAQYSGPVTVCVALDPVPSGSSLLHYNQKTHTWENFTMQPVPANGPICTQVDSLSPFAVVAGGDTTPPSIALSSPVDGATYALNQTVTAHYSCTDAGSGIAACAGTVSSGAPIATGSAGQSAFTVTAADNAGNTAVQTVHYTVGYNVCLLYDPAKAKKSGSAYPIQIQLCDAAGHNVSSAAIVVHAVGVTQLSTSAPGTLADAGNSNPDFDFRYDATLAGYIFNLKTTGYATGTYALTFTAGTDPAPHSALFQIK